MEWNEIKKDVLKKDENNASYRGYYSIVSEKGYGISKDLLIIIIQEPDYAMYDKSDDDYNDMIETDAVIKLYNEVLAEIDTHFGEDDSE